MRARGAPNAARAAPRAATLAPQLDAPHLHAPLGRAPRRLWCAVYLLPFAGVFQPKTGLVNYGRSTMLWEAPSTWTKRRHQPTRTLSSPAARHDPRSLRQEAKAAVANQEMTKAAKSSPAKADVEGYDKLETVYASVLFSPVRDRTRALSTS